MYPINTSLYSRLVSVLSLKWSLANQFVTGHLVLCVNRNEFNFYNTLREKYFNSEWLKGKLKSASSDLYSSITIISTKRKWLLLINNLPHNFLIEQSIRTIVVFRKCVRLHKQIKIRTTA